MQQSPSSTSSPSLSSPSARNDVSQGSGSLSCDGSADVDDCISADINSEDEHVDEDDNDDSNDEQVDNNRNTSRRAWEKTAITSVRSVMSNAWQQGSQKQRRSLLVRSKFFANRNTTTTASSQTRREDLLVVRTLKQETGTPSVSSKVCTGRNVSSQLQQEDGAQNLSQQSHSDSWSISSPNQSEQSEEGLFGTQETMDSDEVRNDSQQMTFSYEEMESVSPTKRRTFSSAFGMSATQESASSLVRKKPGRLLRFRSKWTSSLSQENYDSNVSNLSMQDSGDNGCPEETMTTTSQESVSMVMPNNTRSNRSNGGSGLKTNELELTERLTKDSMVTDQKRVTEGEQLASTASRYFADTTPTTTLAVHVVDHGSHVMDIDEEGDDDLDVTFISSTNQNAKIHRNQTNVIDLSDNEDEDEKRDTSEPTRVRHQPTKQLQLTIFEKFRRYAKGKQRQQK